MDASDILHLAVPGRAPRAKAVARRSAVATSDDILKLARVGQRGQRGRALQKRTCSGSRRSSRRGALLLKLTIMIDEVSL